MKNRKAFTLIEILAVIVVLAIIALIAIPRINEQIEYSKKESVERTVDSLVRSYEYEELNSNKKIGRKDVCDYQDGECAFTGYIERDSQDRIVVFINTPKGCASGNIDDLDVTGTTCGVDDVTPPVIQNIELPSIGTNFVTILVKIEENESMIQSAKFRLLDRNGNPVTGWEDDDYTYEAEDSKVAKKTFSDLTLGTEYYLEVKVTNTSNGENTSSRLYSDGTAIRFVTLGFEKPKITYDTTKWSQVKQVIINYDPNFENKENKFRTLSSGQRVVDDWEVVEDNLKIISILNYHYYVNAKSTSGSSVLTTTTQIGYVDNAIDVLNPKPTIEPLNYKNGSGVNTNLVSLRLKDDKSGIAYYCVTTTNNVNNCSGDGNNTQLNKWVLAVNNASDLTLANKEVRDKTVQHQFSNAGKYYVFLKDAVGNLSDAKEITLYKVEYDLNGGTGNVPYQIKLQGSDLTLTDVTPTRSGYEFLGWDTNPNLNRDNPTYLRKGTYSNDSNIKLYAQWRKTVTITYNANSGTGTVASDKCYRYNAQASCSIKFKNGGFTRTGYTFKG